MTQSDDIKISEDRRDALRYALGIGSGAALAAAMATPASAQTPADNTLDRIRANKVLRIAVLPGELPYFNKDLASGTWSGFSIEMANDLVKLLDVKLEYVESTYGNSILDLQANKIDLGFALNPTPQRALVVDFTNLVFPHPFGAMLRKGLEAKTWADINKPEVKIAVDVGSANEAVARRFAPNATIKSLKSRDEVMLEMSSGRVDCVVNALVLGLTAIAKNPNLGTYKILASPSVTIASGTAVRREADKRWRDFLSVWIDYNRGIGQMREWFVKGLGLAGVKPEDVPVELSI
ncbi:polar amino acid transport system substrate-binding protein [Bradyrhizobium sp. USDA 4518]|uniref:Transporter substrate-binding domain-containing protein n=1 Tax=Bradyrhizobium brasilense TaxID=1419277 RepID=A0ABY8J969_9BRAD|nr:MULTISPECIES: transporter substrate-binding domain-containing protein [Bradyrhizobium]MCP1908609.1 polar amino acid transport system substrate-binding protein [Bradyrhizobium elkanii]MCP1834766.1 polar amino acid transport system substrate-binding protein [Bradyrhizobium sp. USDA 4545]MCP1853877.1 polar amino acid transport system substrate-binding protein [Bradyrhizobium sp. USDA 4541]MCP1919511.1 polar amino acid transport system substrate-binding protein [Bradyrhizobium sp. USDA 4532]OMI